MFDYLESLANIVITLQYVSLSMFLNSPHIQRNINLGIVLLIRERNILFIGITSGEIYLLVLHFSK